jgi:hypothetical protein
MVTAGDLRGVLAPAASSEDGITVAGVRLEVSPQHLPSGKGLHSAPAGTAPASHRSETLVRSSSLDHLAEDTHAARRQGRAPRAESPGMHGPNVVSSASQGTDPAHTRVTAVVRRSWPPAQTPSGTAQSGGQRRKPAASRDGGVHASWFPAPQDHSLAVAVSGLPRIDGLSRIDRFSGSHAGYGWPGLCGDRWKTHVMAGADSGADPGAWLR